MARVKSVVERLDDDVGERGVVTESTELCWTLTDYLYRRMTLLFTADG